MAFNGNYTAIKIYKDYLILSILMITNGSHKKNLSTPAKWVWSIRKKIVILLLKYEYIHYKFLSSFSFWYNYTNVRK
jgi:hypothetical protein